MCHCINRRPSPSTLRIRAPGDGDWLAALGGEAFWCPQSRSALDRQSASRRRGFGCRRFLIRLWSERGHRRHCVERDGWRGSVSQLAGSSRRRQAGRTRSGARDSFLPPRQGGQAGHTRRRRPKMKMTQLIGALRTAVRRSRPTLVAPFEADGHPDHEAVGVACLTVGEDLALPIVRYPIWAWHHARPAAFAGNRWGRFALDAKTQAAKCAAMNCFASQLNPGDSREPIVPAHVLDYFKRDYEAFLV